MRRVRTAPAPRRKHLLVSLCTPPCPRVGWWANHRRILRFGLGPYMRRTVRARAKHPGEAHGPAHGNPVTS